MNDFTSTVGLLRREFRDVHSVVNNIDLRTRRMVEPRSIERPAGLIARLAACAVLSRVERRAIDAVAKQHFANDTDLAALITIKTVADPAQKTVPAWAGHIVTDALQDVADNLLGDTVLSRLRSLGLSYAFVPGRGNVKVPVHAAAPSGGFVGESGAIPVGAMILSSIALKPRKAGCIVTMSRETVQGTPSNVEQTIRTLIAEDVSLMVDGVLLGNGAATASAPAGVLNGLVTLTPSAGSGAPALISDVKQLFAAISPAVRPMLIANARQTAAFALHAPNAALPIIAPYLADGTLIAIDAAAFVSAIGIPEFMTDEDAAIHEETVPLPLSATGSPNVTAAPTRSLWQTASIGIRTLLDCDWALRRSNAVAFITGTTW